MKKENYKLLINRDGKILKQNINKPNSVIYK